LLSKTKKAKAIKNVKH